MPRVVQDILTSSGHPAADAIPTPPPGSEPPPVKVPQTDFNNVLLWILEWIANSPYSQETNDQIKGLVINSYYSSSGAAKAADVMYDLPMNLLLSTFTDMLESSDGFKDSNIPLLVKTLMIKHSEKNPNMWSVSDVKSFLIPIFKEVILSNFRVKESSNPDSNKPTLQDYEYLAKKLADVSSDERSLLDACIEKCESSSKSDNEANMNSLPVLDETNVIFWTDIRTTISKIEHKAAFRDYNAAKTIRHLCQKYPEEAGQLMIEQTLDIISEGLQEPFIRQLYDYTQATNYKPCDYDAASKELRKLNRHAYERKQNQLKMSKVEESRIKIEEIEKKLIEQRKYKLPNTVIDLAPDDKEKKRQEKAVKRNKRRRELREEQMDDVGNTTMNNDDGQMIDDYLQTGPTEAAALPPPAAGDDDDNIVKKAKKTVAFEPEPAVVTTSKEDVVAEEEDGGALANMTSEAQEKYKNADAKMKAKMEATAEALKEKFKEYKIIPKAMKAKYHELVSNMDSMKNVMPETQEP